MNKLLIVMLCTMLGMYATQPTFIFHESVPPLLRKIIEHEGQDPFFSLERALPDILKEHAELSKTHPEAATQTPEEVKEFATRTSAFPIIVFIEDCTQNPHECEDHGAVAHAAVSLGKDTPYFQWIPSMHAPQDLDKYIAQIPDTTRIGLTNEKPITISLTDGTPIRGLGLSPILLHAPFGHKRCTIRHELMHLTRHYLSARIDEHEADEVATNGICRRCVEEFAANKRKIEPPYISPQEIFDRAEAIPPDHICAYHKQTDTENYRTLHARHIATKKALLDEAHSAACYPQVTAYCQVPELIDIINTINRDKNDLGKTVETQIVDGTVSLEAGV